MSIILAIEPDRRRAAQLTGMARAHLRAELLVAASAAEAVEALDGRVPDVLLTAPLLPSQEEAAMAEHLRQLGAAAAHVQTLTIPLLAGAGDRDRPVLSAFRRDRSSRSEPEGCDPKVFAEQITDYLREARERRDTPAPPPRQTPAPAVEVTQPPRLATAKNGTIARLLAAAVEDAPDDFKEFLLPPTPSVPLAPPADEFETEVQAAIAEIGDMATDIPLSRSNEAFSTGNIPTFEPAFGSVGAEQTDDPFAASIDASSGTRLVSLAVDDVPAASRDIAPTAAPATSVLASGLRRHARRAQGEDDGWAFFDPNQYGFPALIAKLDEIASRDSDS
jgi:hypothetical protein